ncbi:MAG: F0F1 ATP synthase subunit A [Deltaproteobacteria bacterium]|nr:F0F1 ATP synthase subunit A [Deltaproteobacteria bacterium]MBW2178463.1 F0F1 ATP synthase subunit A [Deltaproteobacteria bacterium]MBW2296169.1 F0F1 ATP synthase subunit A [Deltaproteobacteria bacterium]MBW2611233.1 F0F1 ATP synthase subunit A [Deltaproteobacteria bacterium]MBW2635419.1 F0F1 ATP synthase subunit A [Deltaproteobacteria bacterium]
MGELGRIHQLIIPILGYNVTINLEVVLMTWIVFAILVVVGILSTRKRGIFPRSMQMFGELFVNQFYDITEDALDREMAKKYGPLICALFMFLVLANWLGIIPHLEEPTKDLNTPLSLGLMGFAIAHYAGIKSKGFKAYAREYMEPMFFMMPLNVIGELAKIVSISFRLFGNIMGGSIIILVVSHLTYSIVLPPLLNAFFGLFVGTIQAFVFTMLTVVYISVQVK